MTSAVSPDIEAKYRSLMQECQQLTTKIVELETDRNEHRYVEVFSFDFVGLVELDFRTMQSFSLGSN
jgi:hypothetical protein